ncbi:MAG: xanthine dehydrogenase family protein subunit M [Rhodocyclaceae bacterium]
MDEIRDHVAPSSLDEALGVAALGDATPLAGGTDLMPAGRSGKLRFGRTLLSLRRIPELRGIAIEGGELRIGALTTIAELMADPLVAAHLPLLAEACRHFASPQIRNAATLGGNVCNASPAGDTLPPLMVLGARVELASKPGAVPVHRTMPLEEFLVGPGRTRREPGELLTALRVPLPAPGTPGRFVKFGTRPALDISAVSIAFAARRLGGALHDVRIAYGAVAPTVVRGRAAEEALEGRALDAQTIAAAARAAREEIQPISDVRASAWYRRQLIHNLLRRMLSDVAQA